MGFFTTQMANNIIEDINITGNQAYGGECVDSNGNNFGGNIRLDQYIYKQLPISEGRALIYQKLLLSKLLEARISFNQDLDPLCWVFDLLRSTSLDGLNIKELGLAVMPDFDQVSLSDLRDEINKEFFELSEAHYTRYIQPKSFN